MKDSMGISFYLSPSKGEALNLPSNLFKNVLHPNSTPFTIITGWGDHCIEVKGCPIHFDSEVMGIYILFIKDHFPQNEAKRIVEEIGENIKKVTDQNIEVIEPVDIIIAVDESGDESVLAKKNADGTYTLLRQPQNEQYKLGEIVKPKRSAYGLQPLILPQSNPNFRSS